MMFVLREDITHPGDTYDPVFVKAGSYPIIRFFDKDRVLVDLNPEWRTVNKKYRLITLLRLKDGKIIQDHDQWGFDERQIK